MKLQATRDLADSEQVRSFRKQSLKSCVYDIHAIPDDLLTWWRDALIQERHEAAPYASPDYARVTAEADGFDIKVCVVQDECGQTIALCAVRLKIHSVKYDVANRVLLQKNFKVTEVMGSHPLVGQDESVYGVLFDAIKSSWPESQGIYHDALAVDSNWSRFIQRQGQHSSGEFVFKPYEQRPWHLIEIKDGFEEYTRVMSSRSRQSRRREVRKLAEHGDINFSRFDTSERLTEFLSVAEDVSEHTWQNDLLGLRVLNDLRTLKTFKAMAQAGILRCYSLCAGDLPLAYLIGYQAYGTFEVAELGYNSNHAKLSAGTVMMYKIIEDLHEHNPPTLLSFGVGDATYKKRFQNRSQVDECVIVLNASLANRAIAVSHRLFLQSLELTKSIIGRKTKD